MSNIKRIGDIEIDQDLEFQRKEWIGERVGWTVMAVLALLAVLGLFGQGIFSRAQSENSTLRVEYSRFERLLAPAEVIFQVNPAQIQNDQIRLHLNRKWLDAYSIQGIVPEPDSTETSADELIYIFNVQPSSSPVEIKFNLQPDRPWVGLGRASLENQPAVQFNQMIYP